MSLRIAAHKSRRGCSIPQLADPVQSWSAAGSRAAQAAARVAARYAQAPSYSQIEAAEANPVPQKVQAAAQPVAAEQPVESGPRLIEPDAYAAKSVRSSARVWEQTVAPVLAAAPASLEDWENEFSHNHWEPDPGLRPLETILAPVQATMQAPVPAPIQVKVSSPVAESTLRLPEQPVPEARNRRERFTLPEEPLESEEIEPVEPDQPLPANLIEFPRELVATRKMRPRRAEGPFATARQEAQLSIFEVDPGAISTYPESASAEPVAWPEPAWAQIELEAQQPEEAEPEEMTVALPTLHLAPLGRRLTAALLDGALIAGVLSVFTLAVLARVGAARPTKALEVGAGLTVLLAVLLYHALFLILAEETPGMKCAGLSLCTFDGQIPSRAQLRSRLSALLLSLIPVGLGLAWALFDDDHLCWHDRLSKTYLRMN